MCDTASFVNLTSTGYGVMTSPNYPTFEPFKNCARDIIAPADRIVKIYVTDISMGTPDQSGQ